jgi:energy-coupling factor transporter ATP-binding protein EcfA2
MLLGDILVAKGLVTKEDIERALEHQRENGGRFGDCLVALGVVTEEQIDEVVNEVPEAPRNLSEIDVDFMLLLQLMIKGMHVENFETPSQITNAMKLPDAIVNELLVESTERKLVEIVGQADSRGGLLSEMRYQLSQAGREWALESLEQNQYFGPAPVTLESFTNRVMHQRITNEWVTREDIDEAFKELVIPDRFVDRLGPSINSGTAILIYGPAGNGKTTIAEIIGGIFANVIYVPYCFEVDGQIVKLFDPSVHKPINDDDAAGNSPPSIVREHMDKRWVPCYRPMVITGGELTLDMLDLKFSEISKFYEAPLHIKAINGLFVVDDFGRQRAAPEDILNRWILPLSTRVDYLSLHTGKSFQVPFDELVIFSTNMHPADLMDPAFLRRITYKLETVEPPEDLYRQVFENASEKAGLTLTNEIYQQVLDEVRVNNAPLAYYHPVFIVGQVLASCKFLGIDPQYTSDIVHDAMLNLFIKDREEASVNSFGRKAPEAAPPSRPPDMAPAPPPASVAPPAPPAPPAPAQASPAPEPVGSTV